MKIQKITHPVNDYASWKRVYDQWKPYVQDLGVREIVVLRDSENPNLISVIVEETKPGGFDSFWSDEKLKGAMGEAGVAGPPEISNYTQG